ncbi:ATP-binding protein [Verrucomicrobium sp. BvORR106]|uniref:sensor histidine kinase n=1 Tax=Verrucomicrobium sp. BvORR106 TaxID=1403819 RepID=UPI002240FE93|nr:ATP-binding protein [Verrucomicrobium sp. BvORR106]
MKRLMTLHLLVPAAVACFGMALIVVGYLRNEQQLRERSRKELWDNAYREGTRLSHIAQHLLRKGLVQAADLELSYVALSPHLALAVICDGDDVVRHASQIQWRGVSLKETPLEAIVPRLAGIRKELNGQVAIFPDGEQLWAVFPFFERSTTTPFVVVLSYDLVGPKKEATRLARHESISQSLGLLGGSLVLWMMLDALITRRIARILTYAKQVASGRSPGVPATGADEIGAVGQAFADTVGQLRSTEKQLLEAAEQERWRLGMDLHDDICQRIAAAQLKAGVLGVSLARENSPHSVLAKQVAEQLSDAADIARGYARGLAPATLDRDGLNAALRDMTGHLTKAFGVPMHHDTDPRVLELPDPTQVHLFRIAQELATNAAKHARASFINISLAFRDRFLELKVESDGRRFEMDSGPMTGMGLQLVNQRVRALSGRLLFLERDEPGGGTVVVCVVPVAPRLDH